MTDEATIKVRLIHWLARKFLPDDEYLLLHNLMGEHRVCDDLDCYCWAAGYMAGQEAD